MDCLDMPSRTVLGTAQFEPAYGFDERRGELSADCRVTELFDTIWKKGVREIDTAVAYGQAHEKIQSYLIRHPDKWFNITTKFTEKNARQRKSIEELVSLQNCPEIEVLLHRELDLDNSDAISFARRFVENNKKVTWGVSVYQLEFAEKVLKLPDCSVVQIPLSILNQDFANSEFIECAQKKGIKVVARSIYSLGIVFKPLHFFHSFPPSVKDVMAAIHEFSNSHNVSIASIACLFSHWVGVDKWIVGANSVSQIEAALSSVSAENLESLFAYLSQQSRNWDSALFRPELWDDNFRKNLLTDSQS